MSHSTSSLGDAIRAAIADAPGGADLAESLGLRDPEGASPRELTAREFGKAIIDSRQYRESVLMRVTSGDLPPAVEIRYLDYALGRPIERMRVEDGDANLEGMSLAELEAEALRLAGQARDGQRREPSVDVDEGPQGSDSIPGGSTTPEDVH